MIQALKENLGQYVANISHDEGLPDHGQRSAEETGGDSLERGESDVSASQVGIEDKIEDGDEDLGCTGD